MGIVGVAWEGEGNFEGSVNFRGSCEDVTREGKQVLGVMNII